MKTVITAKLKLHTTPSQFSALRATQLAYRDSLNFVSRYAFEHGKMSNAVRLQDGTYTRIRARFQLPSQMACSVPRQVGATYKTLWKKVQQNAQSRIVVAYTGSNAHVARIGRGTGIGAAKLWYDKAKKRFYLLVSLEVETADPTPETHTSIVGVDVGIRYLAVACPTQGKPSFYAGKRVVSQANHYARLRKRLQKKGTRSATRRLVAISGRERRLKADANHVVSKRIVTQHPHSLMGLENLTDIRERTRRRTHTRKKHGKGVERVSSKQRKSNRVYSQWSFAELHRMIAYKALLAGSMAIKVDAHYTSKACPVCGHSSDANRPNKGLLFVCQHCHYTLHADLVGARNVAMRTLLARQDWASTGHLSVAPDVSNVETKAARLRRYAELRWSLDTSPAPLGQGD